MSRKRFLATTLHELRPSQTVMSLLLLLLLKTNHITLHTFSMVEGMKSYRFNVVDKC